MEESVAGPRPPRDKILFNGDESYVCNLHPAIEAAVAKIRRQVLKFKGPHWVLRYVHGETNGKGHVTAIACLVQNPFAEPSDAPIRTVTAVERLHLGLGIVRTECYSQGNRYLFFTSFPAGTQAENGKTRFQTVIKMIDEQMRR